MTGLQIGGVGGAERGETFYDRALPHKELVNRGERAASKASSRVWRAQRARERARRAKRARDSRRVKRARVRGERNELKSYTGLKETGLDELASLASHTYDDLKINMPLRGPTLYP